MERPTVPRRVTTVLLVRSWLIFLAVFEAVVVLRLASEPVASVMPLFLGDAAGAAATEGGAFRPLMRTYLMLIVALRVTAAWDVRSVPVWRLTAVAHCVHLGYFVVAAWSPATGVFGPRGPRKPPAPAMLVLGVIAFNAAVFVAWWAWLRVRERREAREAERERKRADAAAAEAARRTEALQSEDEVDAHEDAHEADDEDDEDEDEAEAEAQAEEERRKGGLRRRG